MMRTFRALVKSNGTGLRRDNAVPDEENVPRFAGAALKEKSFGAQFDSGAEEGLTGLHEDLIW